MIPEVGKFYHFWDDGKCGVSRHYIAKCEEIIPIKFAETYLIADQYHNKKSLLKLSADNTLSLKVCNASSSLGIYLQIVSIS